MRSIKKTALVCMLVMSFCLLTQVHVSAEDQKETQTIVDGSALIEGTFAQDVATILTRGNYLSNGVVQIQNMGNRVVAISGTTSCHLKCDQVICNLYLEQLSDDGYWYTYDYWICSTTNAYTYSPTRTISVEGGHWYRARGAHSAIENGVRESVSTRTNGIWIG